MVWLDIRIVTDVFVGNYHILNQSLVVLAPYRTEVHYDVAVVDSRDDDAEYVSVEVNTGLLAEFARHYEGAVLIKGLRAASDFDYEFQMDSINKRLNPALETMFLTADQRYTFLSSSIVRELANYGADLCGLVPEEIIGLIEEKAKGVKKYGQQ